MKVLSLFDGMACGMLAFMEAGIKVDRYVAYEIDKYAVQTSSHNFPMIEHRGDVFEADFTEFRGFDFLIGGSPCTHWSIARLGDRETKASGVGWELFCQYVRALQEAKPKYFIYENNKSMHDNIRAAITEAFGFEPICINSALVSAQNRQRLYWVGTRNPDGTYSKVTVDQPEDMGILLVDVLETGVPINTTVDGYKARTLMAGYYKYGTATLITNPGFTGGTTAVAEPVRACESETVLKSIPDIVSKYGYLPEMFNAYNRSEITDKAPTLSTGSMVTSSCAINRFEPVSPIPIHTTAVAELVPFVEGKLADAVAKIGYIPKMWNPYNNTEITDKAPTQTAQCASQTKSSTVMIVTPLAVAIEWDENGKPTKAISVADGKTHPVYEVKDGQITIKSKQYPIKLADGFYIIRKLTVSECKRLQTVPGWYKFPVSDSQAYKMLGNGWTVDVIAHLINATQNYIN